MLTAVNENGVRCKSGYDPNMDYCMVSDDSLLSEQQAYALVDGKDLPGWRVQPKPKPAPMRQGIWVHLGYQAWCVGIQGGIQVGDDAYAVTHSALGQPGLRGGVSSYITEILGTTDDGHTLCLIAAQSQQGQRIARLAFRQRFDRKRK